MIYKNKYELIMFSLATQVVRNRTKLLLLLFDQMK